MSAKPVEHLFTLQRSPIALASTRHIVFLTGDMISDPITDA